MNKTHLSVPINQDQINNLLNYIDYSQKESVKDALFTRLGYECFYSRDRTKWIDQYKGNLQEFIDSINILHKSKYWERLILSADGKQIILTGKEVNGCACSYSAGKNPPLSLCNYCCKSFQKELFQYLLEKPVEIAITESILFGNTRCSTIINIA
jgi:hypothetical protein